jgi:hypothetical protein
VKMKSAAHAMFATLQVARRLRHTVALRIIDAEAAQQDALRKECRPPI